MIKKSDVECLTIGVGIIAALILAVANIANSGWWGDLVDEADANAEAAALLYDPID